MLHNSILHKGGVSSLSLNLMFLPVGSNLRLIKKIIEVFFIWLLYDYQVTQRQGSCHIIQAKEFLNSQSLDKRIFLSFHITKYTEKNYFLRPPHDAFFWLRMNPKPLLTLAPIQRPRLFPTEREVAIAG